MRLPGPKLKKAKTQKIKKSAPKKILIFQEMELSYPKITYKTFFKVFSPRKLNKTHLGKPGSGEF